MESVKERTLRLALAEVGLSSLPCQYRDGMGWWDKSILLVRRRGLQESYALAERSVWGVMRIVRDFGPIAPIVGVLGIYPYAWLRGMMGVGPGGYRDEDAMRTYLRIYFNGYYSRAQSDAVGSSDRVFESLRLAHEGRMRIVSEGSMDELSALERLRVRDLSRLGIKDLFVPISYLCSDSLSACSLSTSSDGADVNTSTYDVPDGSREARPARVRIKGGRPRKPIALRADRVDVSDPSKVGVKKRGRPRKVRPEGV